MKALITFVILLVLSFAFSLYASENSLRGKHLQANLKCVDCHETSSPDKPAKTSVCIGCHDKGPDVIVETSVEHYVYKLPVHNAHTGPLRCVLCHKVHKPSELMCKQCHPQFEVMVP
ncbi:MAG: cytochrome c3 family protein [Deferribacterales bacterium]